MIWVTAGCPLLVRDGLGHEIVVELLASVGFRVRFGRRGRGRAACRLVACNGKRDRGGCVRGVFTSCMSMISGKPAAMALNFFSRAASAISSSPDSMVAGSLSMCVRIVTTSGTSARISDSSWVTRSWASLSSKFSLSSRCCSTCSLPSRSCTLTSWTLTLWRVATARMRSKMLSSTCGLGQGADHDVGVGEKVLNGGGDGADDLFERWNVTTRGRATERSTSSGLRLCGCGLGRPRRRLRHR